MDNHPVFNRTLIATVHIRMSAENLQLLRDAETMNKYPDGLPANWSFDNGIIRSQISNVGIKVKGFSSRFYGKKSWKISFDEYKKQNFYGLTKIGLKGNGQDMSGQRGAHEADLLRAVGVPTARNSWANVYINNMNFGLFWLEEVVDKTWLNSRFGNKNGNLYKVAGGMLTYLGTNPQSYKVWPPWGISGGLPGTPLAYELKYQGKDDTYADIASVCVAIHQPHPTFAEELPKVFNVELFMRSILVISTVVNVDTFSLDGNNWMMYYDTNTDKIQFITHDYDLSFNTLPSLWWVENGKNITAVNYSPWNWGTAFPFGLFPKEFLAFFASSNAAHNKSLGGMERCFPTIWFSICPKNLQWSCETGTTSGCF